MISKKEWPFNITPDNIPEFMGKCSEHITRRGRDMAGHYLEAPEPEKVIYEVYEAETNGHLCLALTILKPGKVGKEFHMTKGHYHEDPEAGEIYFAMKGTGMILMQTKDGHTSEMRLSPGGVVNIPPGWAHRTVNVGKDDFVMLAIYPATSGHDYGSIEKDGFIKRVLEEKGKPLIF